MIKVSEYASWSIRYYKRIIDGCLDAVGAPRDLVQFVVGYGATGSALVTSGVDKVVDRRYRQLDRILHYLSHQTFDSNEDRFLSEGNIRWFSRSRGHGCEDSRYQSDSWYVHMCVLTAAIFHHS